MDDTAIVAAPSKPPPPKPNTLTFRLDVPVGHVLPLDEEPFSFAVEQPFDVTVVAGARWHPEWDAPRIAVNAFRTLNGGAALCWAGKEAKALPLPLTIAMMANHHGDLIDEELARQFTALGLTVPDKPEPYAAFHAQRSTDTYTMH